MKGRIMASIRLRNLGTEVKARLRVRAAEHRRSMEEEARQILREAVKQKKALGISPTPSVLRSHRLAASIWNFRHAYPCANRLPSIESAPCPCC